VRLLLSFVDCFDGLVSRLLVMADGILLCLCRPCCSPLAASGPAIQYALARCLMLFDHDHLMLFDHDHQFDAETLRNLYPLTVFSINCADVSNNCVPLFPFGL